MSKFEGAVLSSDEAVIFIPDTRKEPEEYAGFMGNNVRVYISTEADLSEQILQVLEGTGPITTVSRIVFG